MIRHIHARSDELHTLTTQARPMAGECWDPIGVHDAMEGYVSLVAVP
jgi:hypothetical protein